MSKSTKGALIAAAVLIALGILFCAASFAVSGWDPGAYETGSESYVRKSCTYSPEDVRTFVFQDSSHDVELIRSDDDKIHITYYESQKTGYTFELGDDGTLMVFYHSDKKWYDAIGISFRYEERKTVVAVPDGFTGDISVKLGSADLEISGFKVCGSLTAESTSGEVQISDFICTGNIKIEQTSGDFEGKSLSASSVFIKHTSGDIEMERLDLGELSLVSVSGDIEVENIKVETDCTLHSTSGDISLSDAEITGLLTCESTSGDITAESVSLGEAIFSSTSGNIRAEIIGSASDYHIDAKTTSGRIRIPENGNGGRTIRVKTTSGNISVSFR